MSSEEAYSRYPFHKRLHSCEISGDQLPTDEEELKQLLAQLHFPILQNTPLWERIKEIRDESQST
jgi:hypothetical protein